MEPATAGDAETPEGLWAQAEVRAAAGDFRGAFQATFRWLLVRLHRDGRIAYDPALTNREHLGRLRGDTPLWTGFADLANRFELAWYALRPVGPNEYGEFRAACEAMVGGRR
jgi:hypothetical protein